VSALALTLLGLSAWLAERGSRSVRRASLSRRLPEIAVRAGRRPPTVPTWTVWCVAGSLVGLAVGGAMLAVAGAAAGAVAWRIRGRRRRRIRDAERDDQLVDAVASIAGALRAGRSVPQAISFAADEARPPLADPMRELDRAVQLGVPVDDAVLTWSRELDTDDARLLAGVLGLHRRTGGDLPAVLDEVAGTLRERRGAGREIRALTAQARLSGTILGVLPFGFFAFLWLTSRREIEGAFRSPAGVIAIALGLALEGLAFLWIRHLLAVR